MRKMKDSGVEWIGEIPVDWKLSKIGSVYDERNEKVSDKDFAPLSVTKQGIVPQLETAAKTDNGDNRKLIRKDDFVINSRSDRRGSCGISEYEGSCSLINTVLKPQTNMCNRYYGFVFKSENFADEYYRWGHGIVNDLWSTKWSDMKSIYIPMPNMEEQRRIANYLDCKCPQIDAIIEKQQKIIEKLKEYKLSLITETVTKGLTPDVEMKDTGIEWIGKIPCNWQIVKLKTFIDCLPGYAFSSDDYSVNDGIPLLRGINVTTEGIRWDETVYWNKKVPDNLIPYFLEPNDIVVGLDRPWISNGMRVTVMDEKNLPCLLLQRVCRIRTTGKHDFRLVYHWINSQAFEQSLSMETTGVSVPHISTKQIENFVIALPPIDEEKKICDYLDKKCNAVNTTLAYRSKAIEKLQEYKKSLIYEVVTGKKEV